MMTDGDRRLPGVNRVRVQTTVELCGLDPHHAAAFEAESLDVSGRGLHVRTGYVPEVGSALVCRFQDRGREIIAEGVVAWSQPDSRGGEFGLKFTALDSGSVDALRTLTGLDGGTEDDDEGADEPLSVEPPATRESAPRARVGAPATGGPSSGAPAPVPPTPQRIDPGARVKLHIDGLGAPMKALVRNGTRSRVKVGSKLEFLRVGRRLEIENLDSSARRGACIDAVDVVLDPQSGVPQLVVALHYDDVEDVTPDPTVLDREPETLAAHELSASGAAATRFDDDEELAPAPLRSEAADYDGYDGDEGEDGDEGAELAPEEQVAREASAFQSKLSVAAQRAGDLAQRTGATLARLGGVAVVGAAKLARQAGARVGELKQRRGAAAPPRRQTAPAPQGALSADGRRLRPQQGPAPSATQRKPEPAPARSFMGTQLLMDRRVGRVAVGAGLLLVAITLLTFALRGKGSASAPQNVAAAAPAAAPSASAAGDVTQVDAQGNPIAGGPRRLRDANPATREGISADVPLFGPTPMATMEPAPLDPAPEADEGEGDAPPAAKAQPVDDETFEDEIVKANESWGKGRLHLPTIHRIRLDGPGKQIKGSVTPSGFTVFVPGAKAVEQGDAIARRDKRIVKVSAANEASGVRITFRFRDGVPPYRVRLKQDFIEFSISAPSE